MKPNNGVHRAGAGEAELQLLEQAVERIPGIVGIARCGRPGIDCSRRRGRAGRTVSAVAGDRHPGREQSALVGLVLDRDTHRDRLHALEPGGWLEMSTLFAAMQFSVALGAISGKVGAGRQGGSTIETAGGRDVLHQAGQARSGHVQGRTRALGFWPVIAERLVVAIRVHVPVLSVFAVAIHMGKLLRVDWGWEDCRRFA